MILGLTNKLTPRYKHRGQERCEKMKRDKARRHSKWWNKMGSKDKTRRKGLGTCGAVSSCKYKGQKGELALDVESQEFKKKVKTEAVVTSEEEELDY